MVFVVLQHLVDVAPALIVYSCFLGAEIQAPHQFTDNDKVNSVTDDLGSKWRKMREFRREGNRAEVGLGLVAPSHGQ